MPLRESALTVRFVGGIDRKTDHKSVPTTKLLALENAVFTKSGSLIKRNGYETLSQAIAGSASTTTGLKRLARRDDEMLAFDSNTAFSHQSEADEWIDSGAVIAPIGSDRIGVRTGTEQSIPDHATNGGVTVFAWEDSRGGVWACAQDATSGRYLFGPSQMDAAGISPRCVAVGDNLHIYYAVAAQQRIMVAVVVPTAATTVPTPAILIEDLLSTNPVYDACPTGRTDTPALIAWAMAGTTSYRVGYVVAGGTLASPLSGHPGPETIAASMSAASPIACAYIFQGEDSDKIGVAYVKSDTNGKLDQLIAGTNVDPIALDATSTMYATTVDVERIALTAFFDETGITIGTFWAVYEEAAAQSSQRFCVINSCVVDATPGAQTTQRSLGLASRAWCIDTDAFATFVHDTTYFNTYVALRLSDFAPCGRMLPGQAAGPTRAHLPSAHVTGDTAVMALPYKERVLSENSDQFTETGVRLVSLDFESEDSHQTAQLGRGLYMAAACPLHYDGKQWTEQGFHVGPELITTVNSGSGSLDDSNTYLYRAWYEWTDAQGEIHRGPTSFGTTVVLGAGEDEVTLTLPTLRVTQKTNVRICVARSTVTLGETQLFRVTSSNPSASGPNGYVANDKTVNSVTFVDRMSDATAATQEPLYTNGGVLSTDPSALGSIIVGGQSRLFTTDPSDGNLIRFSQTLDPGFGVEFPPELFTACDPFGGDITALGSMDGTIYAFKQSAIYAFAGDGPLPNGQSDNANGFTTPQLISSDVGCTDPASIVLTPVGLMFKTAKGIYLLDRSRSVSYVGAPVEAYNAQVISRAVVMPDRTQVVFLTDSGTTLLYDYLFGQWSTFTNHLGRDGVVVSGVFHYLRTDDRVFRETVGAYSDAGTRIPLRLETAWINMVGHLQGWQMFWHAHLLGERMSAHQLKMQYRLNYKNDWSDPWYVDATGIASQTGWISGDNAPWIGTGEDSVLGTAYGDGAYGSGPYGGTAPGTYEWRLHIGYHGKAIQFAFEDFEAAGFAGASFELSELTITGGVDAPVNRRVSAGRSV